MLTESIIKNKSGHHTITNMHQYTYSKIKLHCKPKKTWH